MLSLLNFSEKVHDITLARICHHTIGFFNDFLCDVDVATHVLTAHLFETGLLILELSLNLKKPLFTLFKELSQMETTVHIRVLKVVESLMSWLESNQSEPIWFIIYRRQINTLLCQFFTMHVLELRLDKFDCIVLFNFAHEKDNEI